MINIINKSDCCGCRVCETICPVQCITMELDSEQFYYPKVDITKCINCERCKKVCPNINIPLKYNPYNDVYATWSKDTKIRYDASSGGMFEIIARNILEKHGVVFGAAFDENLQLIHKYATTVQELKPLCKSKYLQSNMNHSYKSIKNFLDADKYVLLVGTPCQIAALRNYLGKSYDKLILVDLVCHGVPSQELFNSCIRYEEKQRGIKIKKYVFRTKKKRGATLHYYTKGYEEKGKYKEKIGIYYKSPYYLGFQKYITLRPSCYKCHYSNPKRVSDITIGDFHEIERYVKNVDRMKGISMVIINTPKGKYLFDSIKNRLEIIKLDLNTAIISNPCLEKPTPMPVERQQFFEDLRTKDFRFVVNSHLKSKKSWILDLYYSIPKSIRFIIKKLVVRE